MASAATELNIMYGFFDMNKEFDCVNRTFFWYKLMGLGVSGKFFDAAKSLNGVFRIS